MATMVIAPTLVGYGGHNLSHGRCAHAQQANGTPGRAAEAALIEPYKLNLSEEQEKFHTGQLPYGGLIFPLKTFGML